MAVKDWDKIVEGSGKWFEPDTMKFWNSTVYWNTLYKVDATNYYFITSEDNFDKSQILFSIRKARFTDKANVSIDTVKWQEFETLADADFALAEIICEND